MSWALLREDAVTLFFLTMNAGRVGDTTTHNNNGRATKGHKSEQDDITRHNPSVSGTRDATMSSHIVSYLTADFFHSEEILAFCISFQGAMQVRAGVNKDLSKHWFHAFLLTLATGNGGATFAPLWMGKPVSMLNNDFHVACCILCFILVTYVPACFKLGQTLPVTIVTVMFAQLFRAVSIAQLTSQATKMFAASAFYPVPVFAPIAYGTLLGNMGGFFSKSFHNRVQNHGMPWSFQNGTHV